MEHVGDGDINSNWCTCINSQNTDKGTVRPGNKRTNRDHSDYSIIKIDEYTDKSTRESRRLAVTQTPVEDYQLMLVWKILKVNNYYNNNNANKWYMHNPVAVLENDTHKLLRDLTYKRIT